MGSIDEKTNLEAEELTFSSSAATGDVEALHFETVHLHSGADAVYSWITKNIGRIRTPRSFYFVLFNAKITMLLSFGPLAFWLHYFTQKKDGRTNYFTGLMFIICYIMTASTLCCHKIKTF